MFLRKRTHEDGGPARKTPGRTQIKPCILHSFFLSGAPDPGRAQQEGAGKMAAQRSQEKGGKRCSLKGKIRDVCCWQEKEDRKLFGESSPESSRAKKKKRKKEEKKKKEKEGVSGCIFPRTKPTLFVAGRRPSTKKNQGVVSCGGASQPDSVSPMKLN